MSAGPNARVVEAVGPEGIVHVRALFLEYAISLDFGLCFQGFVAELYGLPGAYVAPRGASCWPWPGTRRRAVSACAR
jgi:hypothetical protein